jgi:hypothetical protein
MVGPLFRRGAFFFSGGIGEDVLGNLFSSRDLLREQVKAENEEGWTMRLQSRAKERIDRKLTLEWCVSLVECCSSRWAAFPCPPWPWGFFLWSMERRREVIEVYASGFAEHRGGYFISCENAFGMMTSWRTLMGIPNGRVLSLNAKGFSLNGVHGS